jgi:hypothetical protein
MKIQNDGILTVARWVLSFGFAWDEWMLMEVLL